MDLPPLRHNKECVMSNHGDDDRDLLQRLLDHDDLKEHPREAFSAMLRVISTTESPYSELTSKQRHWARMELKALEGEPSTRLTDGPVPRGRPVEMAAVLRAPLPKAPPGRKVSA